jgi:tRNA threonylcarbamoyladenosine biosynthesis protein TsaB
VILGAGDAPVLALDASSARATVAVLRGARIVAEGVAAMRGGQGAADASAERLLPAIARVLDAAGVRVADLAAVVCGAGPGGFTSLRIAAATAKGIAEAVGAPLGAISSLLLIAAGRDPAVDARYLVSVDALRGERFTALVEVSAAAGSARQIGESALVLAADVPALADASRACVIGPDGVLQAWPEARAVLRVRDAVQPVDRATWEPEYGRRVEAEVRRDAARLPV